MRKTIQAGLAALVLAAPRARRTDGSGPSSNRRSFRESSSTWSIREASRFRWEVRSSRSPTTQRPPTPTRQGSPAHVLAARGIGQELPLRAAPLDAELRPEPDRAGNLQPAATGPVPAVGEHDRAGVRVAGGSAHPKRLDRAVPHGQPALPDEFRPTRLLRLPCLLHQPRLQQQHHPRRRGRAGHPKRGLWRRLRSQVRGALSGRGITFNKLKYDFTPLAGETDHLFIRQSGQRNTDGHGRRPAHRRGGFDVRSPPARGSAGPRASGTTCSRRAGCPWEASIASRRSSTSTTRFVERFLPTRLRTSASPAASTTPTSRQRGQAPAGRSSAGRFLGGHLGTTVREPSDRG